MTPPADSTKDDGGPAFPESYLGADIPHQGVGGGMSLRDWYAGMVMTGLAVNFNDLLPTDSRSSIKHMVGMAYEIADAMLKERKNG